MPSIRNSYSGNTLSTTMGREGLDVPNPNIWDDLEMIRKMGGLDDTAGGQAKALRGSRGVNAPAAASASAGSPRSPQQQEFNAGMEPYFGVWTNPGGQGGFYNSYTPGQNLGAGQQPVAMGFRRVGRERR